MECKFRYFGRDASNLNSSHSCKFVGNSLRNFCVKEKSCYKDGCTKEGLDLI